MRFHQAVTFLPVDEMMTLSVACDTMGYSGVYFSDHLFNPRDLQSRYTYSKAPDGAPFWEKETAWPDPMCLISALSAVTTNLTFTTGIYIAPVRDLMYQWHRRILQGLGYDDEEIARLRRAGAI